MRAKYIVIQFMDEHDRLHFLPIIFPHLLAHADMWEGVVRSTSGAVQPVSAGFVDLVGRNIKCFGRSETLNLDSRPVKDAALITALNGERATTLEEKWK